MKLFDLPYVLATALVGFAFFGVGRWSAPSHREVVYVPSAPVVQATPEPMVPPPPSPPPEVTPVPVEAPAATPAAHYENDASAPVEIGDNLMPVLKRPPPVMASSHVQPPVVTVKQPPKPDQIVLEEIPENPYARK